MSELAALAAIAPDVEASLDVADAVPPGMQEALAAVVADLRAEAALRDGDSARLLAEFADRLEAPRAWLGVDRFVHELLGDLLRDALAVSAADRVAALSARAFALKGVARHAPLWPGAGARHGCPYGYESLLAVVRLTGLAA